MNALTYLDGRPMRAYHLIISEATGERNEQRLDRIEDCMRNDIFHSTLDLQTRDQLVEAAREAVELLAELDRMDWNNVASPLHY